jgi:putative endonuclease
VKPKAKTGNLIFPAKWNIDRRMDKSSFFYVYIIQSLVDPNRFYTGFTKNIENRLKDHNSGKNSHTAELKPWRIKTAVAFTNRQKAHDFESYLKTISGRAFAKKRL